MSKKIEHISEEEKLKRTLSLTYTERFESLIKLIHIDRMLKSAKIIEAKKDNTQENREM